jgi:hypothetical protein
MERNQYWPFAILAGTGVLVLVTGQIWLYTRSGRLLGQVGSVPLWFSVAQLGALVLIVLAVFDLARRLTLETVFQKRSYPGENDYVVTTHSVTR